MRILTTHGGIMIMTDDRISDNEGGQRMISQNIVIKPTRIRKLVQTIDGKVLFLN